MAIDKKLIDDEKPSAGSDKFSVHHFPSTM